jgi:hypothetical protein
MKNDHAPIHGHGKAPHDHSHKMMKDHLKMYAAGGCMHHSDHVKKHAAGGCMMEHEKVAKMCGGGMYKK